MSAAVDYWLLYYLMLMQLHVLLSNGGHFMYCLCFHVAMCRCSLHERYIIQYALAG